MKTQNEANMKFMDVEKKSKTSYAKFFPNVIKEMQEWGDIRQRLATNQTSPVSYFFNITTYTADSTEASLAAEQQVLNSYRKGGFQLIPARYHHLRNFLAMMPFKCGEGLFKELQAAGVVKRAETFRWLTSCRSSLTARWRRRDSGAHLPKSAGVHRPVLRGNEQYQFQHGSLRDVRGG